MLPTCIHPTIPLLGQFMSVEDRMQVSPAVTVITLRPQTGCTALLQPEQFLTVRHLGWWLTEYILV